MQPHRVRWLCSPAGHRPCERLEMQMPDAGPSSERATLATTFVHRRAYRGGAVSMASTNARSVRTRKILTRRRVELQFTELGFGGAPLGNLYRPMTEKEARVMLEAVWAAGCRYFDTAPLYGLGLSETRLNGFLRPKPRDSYLISSKVGRLLELCKPRDRSRHGAFSQTPSRRY